ncbi:MAG: NADH-quinone oxidoreductase subunit J [Bryobacteraceae bacterium]
MIDTVLFYIFAALTLGGGIFTITRKSAIHSAISLIVSLLGVAGLFLLQGAEFLFAVQIVLYVGGIMVLFLFVIMLVNLDEAAKVRQFNKQWWLALICAAGVAAEFFYAIRKGRGSFQFARAATEAIAPRYLGNTERIANVLFSEYLLPFEVASVLLLAAVVGSVVMAKKRV